MNSIKWIILLVFCSCSCSCSQKNQFIYSKPLDNNKRIFLEKYKTFKGGVYTGDTYVYYLTDSLNFRKKIAVSNFDDERIEVVLKDQEIKVFTLRKNLDLTKFKEDTVSIQIYEINQLKAQR